MWVGRCIFVLSIGLIGVLGCDEKPVPPAEANAVQHNGPSPVAHPVEAPATQPAILMTIDGVHREFPPAKLIVQERNGTTVALLMSDDPPQAINDDYAGNSYYIEMEFSERMPSLYGQLWAYQAPSADRLDSPNGIFLEGNRHQLQPYQVKVEFPAEERDALWITGTFYQFTQPEPGARAEPPRLVEVAGRLVVKLP